MICLVDMEHEQAVRRGAPCLEVATNGRSRHEAYCADLRRRLEETSGDTCLTRRYPDVTREWLTAADVSALVLSGNVTAWDTYDPADLQELQTFVRSGSVPILGLCGGLQFIAMAHGAEVGPIRKLQSAKEDAASDYAPGYLKEWGFTPVRVLRSDPIWEGLDNPVFLEAHYWEVKTVPQGFDILASTQTCRVQMLHRAGTLVYGTQFHPEAFIVKPVDRRNCLIERIYPAGYTRQQPDGYRLLSNFFREVSASGQEPSTRSLSSTIDCSDD